MRGGFEFAGVDIADLGLEYVPDNQNTYVYNPAAYSVHEQKFDAHNGGYFYGTTVQPKDFVLRCAYEDIKVSDGVMEKIFGLFRRGVTGRLVFQKRPWVYYHATVVNVDAKQMTNYQNGIVTITLRAYYPFGRSNVYYTENSNDEIMKNSAVMCGAAWEPKLQFGSTNDPIVSQQELLILNPGTEPAELSIMLAGDVGDGVVIANSTTNQSCKFVGLTKAITSNVNKYLLCDGLNGKTVLTNGGVSEYGFLYHDQGFLQLAPGYPITRDITITGEANSSKLKSEGKFTQDMVGRYMVLNDGSWKAKILTVQDENTLYVDGSTANISGAASALTLNKIIVTPVSDMNLTKLQFEFQPTYS